MTIVGGDLIYREFITDFILSNTFPLFYDYHQRNSSKSGKHSH